MQGGARDVIVLVVGNGHSELEFESWMRLFAFHIALITFAFLKALIILPPTMDE